MIDQPLIVWEHGAAIDAIRIQLRHQVAHFADHIIVGQLVNQIALNVARENWLLIPQDHHSVRLLKLLQRGHLEYVHL